MIERLTRQPGRHDASSGIAIAPGQNGPLDLAATREAGHSSAAGKGAGLTETGRVALSIDVEDWFHAANLARAVPPEAWDRCELRVERNTMRMLQILDAANVRATLFVLGWVAERCPRLVRRIAEAGHEVACHGYGHQLVTSLRPDEFRADVSRAKHCLEDLIGAPVRGYRAPSFSITDWAIPILHELGFDYDSSAVPTIAHDRYGKLTGMDAGRPVTLLREGFHEVSLPCLRMGKRGIPWGGGGYFRLTPYALWVQGVRAILRSGRPYVFYIHPWEIDPAQPRVSGMKPFEMFRHRINLGRCEERFIALAGAFPWTTIGDLIDEEKLRAPGGMRSPASARAIGTLQSCLTWSPAFFC